MGVVGVGASDRIKKKGGGTASIKYASMGGITNVINLNVKLSRRYF